MEKLIIRMFAVILFTCGNMVLMSCSDNDDSSGQGQPTMSECTIIFYGVGGGNLDVDIQDNLRQLYRGIRDNKGIEAVVCFKNSANPNADMLKTLQERGFDFHPATTYRFCVDGSLADTPQLQFTPDNIFGGDGGNINITMADTLAHYISYAAAIRPAHHYVLILSDHGRGYSPADDNPNDLQPTTRGVLYDDGNNAHCLSARAIRTAIERSGVAFDGIYLDACLMNCVETLYELQEVAPYIVSATFYTPDVGGEYSCLVKRLATSPTYEQALAGYCDDVADYWLRCEEEGINPGDYDASDINAISSVQLRNAAPTLKAFIEQLTQDYSDPAIATMIDAITAKAVPNETDYPLFDLCAYFDSLTASVPSTALANAARKAKDAMMKCKLNSRGTKTTEKTRLPSFNFLLGANSSWDVLRFKDNKRLNSVTQYNWDGTLLTTQYNEDGTVKSQTTGTWNSTGDETYAKMHFENLTGWSRWIKTNRQKPLSQYK
jgi:hypothetical protein